MPRAGSDDVAPPTGPDVDAARRAPRPSVRRAVRPADGPPVLPDTTADESDVGWGEIPEPDDDERYLREVPPHHGT